MSVTINITPTLFEAGAGKFRSDRRYFRAGASGSRFPIPQGETLGVTQYNDTSGNQPWAGFRYSVNGYVRQMTTRYAPSGDTALNSGSFNASVTLVKI